MLVATFFSPSMGPWDCVYQTGTRGKRHMNFQRSARVFPTLSFQVYKRNRHGRVQARVLRLTATHIENVRSETVTKRFLYAEVCGLRLQDARTLIISYTSDHDFAYISDVAVDICHELSQRIRASVALVSAASSGSSASQSSPGTPTSPSTPLSMSQRLRERGSTQQLDSQSLLSYADPTFELEIDETDLFLTASQPTHSKTAAKLAFLTGHSEQERVLLELRRLVLDPESREYATLQQWVARFNPRMWSGRRAALRLRSWISGFVDHIISTYRERLLPLCVFSADGTLRKLTDATVSAAVLQMGVYSRLFACFSAEREEEDSQLATVMAVLAGSSQDFFSIPASHQDPHNYSNAVRMLSQIRPAEMLPVATANKIIAAAESVYDTCPVSPLSADDFLPIFIYCVCQSKIGEGFALAEILSVLLDPSDTKGKVGYYLTSFRSALVVIRAHHTDLQRGVSSEKLQRTPSAARIAPE